VLGKAYKNLKQEETKKFIPFFMSENQLKKITVASFFHSFLMALVW